MIEIQGGVCSMATQKVRPDPDVVDLHPERRQPGNRNRVIGMIVVIVLIVGGGLAAFIALSESDRAPGDRGDGAPVPVAHEGDVRLIDVASGEEAAGPELGPEVDHVAVSPDGTKVAYISWEGAGPEIVFVASIDGSNIRAYPTTRSPGAARTPMWSPDGSTIVYQRMGEDHRLGALSLLDVVSGDVRKLTDLGNGFGLVDPTFDPTGDSVLYTSPTSTDPPRVNVWSVPATGGDPVLIRRNVIVGDASTSASKITFVTTHIVDGEVMGEDLWVADADGRHADRVVVGPVSFSRWSPDGTRILFADEFQNSLKILDLATGETTALPAQADGADWLDDGTVMIDGSPEV
jgi:Tol biopolymer transport system component